MTRKAEPRADVPPACPRCEERMEPDVLRMSADRLASRGGRPGPPPPVLPTWHCRRCGCFQPRLAA
jgi:hypothetical protein